MRFLRSSRRSGESFLSNEGGGGGTTPSSLGVVTPPSFFWAVEMSLFIETFFRRRFIFGTGGGLGAIAPGSSSGSGG